MTDELPLIGSGRTYGNFKLVQSTWVKLGGRQSAEPRGNEIGTKLRTDSAFTRSFVTT